MIILHAMALEMAEYSILIIKLYCASILLQGFVLRIDFASTRIAY